MLFEFNKTRYGKKRVPHADMDGVQFCLRALSKHKNEKRNHVKRLYVNGETMVATDGNRLHTYKPEAVMPDGYYRPLINTKSEVIVYHEKDNKSDYPKWESLLETPKNVEPVKNLCFGESFIFNSYAIAVRALKDHTLNFGYLKDLGNDYFDMSVRRDENGDEAGLLFTNSKKAVCIMPMRM